MAWLRSLTVVSNQLRKCIAWASIDGLRTSRPWPMSAEADFHAQNMLRVSELNCPSSVSFREQVTNAVGRDLPEVSLDLMAVPAA